MKKIFLLGAGRSCTSLIQYLQSHSEELDLQLTVVDRDKATTAKKIEGFDRAVLSEVDLGDEVAIAAQIKKSDLVISMLPAFMHDKIATLAVESGKPFLTASYVSDTIRGLDGLAKEKRVPVVMEMGLDPGIDHMSAQMEIDEIRAKGWKIKSFKSFTGGLVAPESDNNPWNYKFTWNPRNVVLAGQGVTKFLRNGKYKYIPYHNLFRRLEQVNVKSVGDFEAYPNRDSLKYREIYGLDHIPTIFRGTLRRPGFCEAWNILVQLGLTDDSYQMAGISNMTYRDFTNSFLVYSHEKTVEEKVAALLAAQKNKELMKKLEWLGLFDETNIGMDQASPAQVLQKLLEEKWRLEDGDRDMIVMQHQFVYEKDGEVKGHKSSMVVKGDGQQTAMARTVGIPVGIAAKMILQGKLKQSGVIIPVDRNIYVQVLSELKEYGCEFFTEPA